MQFAKRTSNIGAKCCSCGSTHRWDVRSFGGDNVGGMVSCRLRAADLSKYTELQAGGNASN